MGDFVTGDFVILNFGTHKIWGILSQVNFSLGDFVMGAFVAGGFCRRSTFLPKNLGTCDRVL